MKKFKVGYIGLGKMGKPAAFHILTAGHELFVFARRKVSAEPLLAVGAKWCETPADLASQVDVLFTNVSNTEDVESLLLGEHGAVHGAREGLIVVDMSTIDPLRTRDLAVKLAARGVTFLDAPVSGGEVGAINGSLTIMVGGDATALATVRPILDVLGSKITHMGASGSGQVAKACNQIVSAVTMLGVAEAFRLAERMEVDLSILREALLGGFANSRVLDLHGQRMISDNFEPGFKAHLHAKDMNIVRDLAASLNLPLPSSLYVGELINELAANGGADLDSSAIYRLVGETKA